MFGRNKARLKRRFDNNNNNGVRPFDVNGQNNSRSGESQFNSQRPLDGRGQGKGRGLG